MKIRLGYPVACKTRNLKSAKPFLNRTTKQQFSKNSVNNIFNVNLENIHKILGWNITMDIGCFRLSEYLVPDLQITDYNKLVEENLVKVLTVGTLANDSNQLLSFHSTTLNFGTGNQVIWDKCVYKLKYLASMLDAFKVNNGCIVCHLGAQYINATYDVKNKIIERINCLPKYVKRYIALENDLNWNVDDIAKVCKKTDVMFCYDWHHHRCYDAKYGIKLKYNFDHKGISKALKFCNLTWKLNGHECCKIHISSYERNQDMMQHANSVNYLDYSALRKKLHTLGISANIMIESKGLDLSVLKIHEMLDYYKPSWALTNASEYMV